MKQHIICAFPGLGKSTFVQNNNNAVDYDRCFFQYERSDNNQYNPTAQNVIYVEEPQKINGELVNVYKKDKNYPQNFIDTVKSTPKTIKYIFASTNDDILNALENNDIQYYIILPQASKDGSPSNKYMERYYNRFKTDDEYKGMRNDKNSQNRFINEIVDTYRQLCSVIDSKRLRNCKRVFYSRPDAYLEDILK